MLDNSLKYVNKEVQKAIAMATKNVIEAAPNVALNRGEINGGKIADMVALEQEYLPGQECPHRRESGCG